MKFSKESAKSKKNTAKLNLIDIISKFIFELSFKFKYESNHFNFIF